MFRLEGKRALITGAARGMGQGIAAAFAEQGARVAISDVPGSSLESTEQIVKQFSNDFISIPLDVRDAKQRENGLKQMIEALGGIDILINNAGVNRAAPGLEVTEENWDLIFDVNLKSAFFLTQKVAPYMIKAGWGRIIFISSQSGLVAIPGQLVYCTTKGAVLQMSRTLGVEWAKHGVTVNSIAPTFVKTPLTEARLENPEFLNYVLGMIPCGKLAEVKDVANAAIFLASEEAKMITSHTLCVDGGWTAW